MNPIKYYQTKQSEAELRLGTLKKKITVNSVFRLVSFAAIFGSLFGLLESSMALAISGAVVFLIIFLVLVKRHIVLQKDRRYYQEKIKILTSEINACNHDFRDFDEGVDYINTRHSFTYDLDIFGKGSVFCMLNRTVTKSGEKKLAGILSSEKAESGKIEMKQKAIRELSQNPDFTIHFRTTGRVSDLEKEDRLKIEKWANTKSFLPKGIFFRTIIFLLPLTTMFFLILSIINVSNSPLFILFLLINLFFISRNLNRINKEHNQVSHLLKLLQKYSSLIRIVEQEDFQSKALKESVNRLKHMEHTAGESLNRLTKLVSLFDNRLNFVAAIFLEGLFLWDYHCIWHINNWREDYGARLDQWFEEISFFDSAISFAGYAFNNPEFIYPETSESVILDSKKMGHPSIPKPTRVCNDFSVNKKGDFVIITGANMAGKSTFLRTVGINLILARSGAPVCAEYFVFKPMKLFTSMRTSDSLAENESYFYAELRRLQEMLHKLENEGEVFIILDEILKGTNSVDKQKGSYAAMEKIIKLGGTGIIATHDLTLTEISKKYSENVLNKCFEIEIDNASISFDYKLYDGVTQKMNAMLLMEQMGII